MNIYQPTTASGPGEPPIPETPKNNDLRNHFAGLVLTPIMQDGFLARQMKGETAEELAAGIAKICFTIADAMVAESRK